MPNDKHSHHGRHLRKSDYISKTPLMWKISPGLAYSGLSKLYIRSYNQAPIIQEKKMLSKAPPHGYAEKEAILIDEASRNLGKYGLANMIGHGNDLTTDDNEDNNPPKKVNNKSTRDEYNNEDDSNDDSSDLEELTSDEEKPKEPVKLTKAELKELIATFKAEERKKKRKQKTITTKTKKTKKQSHLFDVVHD